MATGVLVLCFIRPLLQLCGFALGTSLYSHVLLIPFISLYLVWERRKSIPGTFLPDRTSATVSAILGLACLAGVLYVSSAESSPAIEDLLALEVPAFLFFLGAVCFVFLGRQVVRMLAFPLAFLFFMTPCPLFLMNWIVSSLQHGSAIAADLMFDVAGTPVIFHGLVFQLPDISLEVAPECSGVHSSLALLVTSFIAAFLFLRSPWKRATLIVAVIPLAIIRNGFRIFTIGELCVHYGPQMIDSYIHRRGGPVFFALSLIPFFILLVYLAKGDRRLAVAARNQVDSERK